MQSISTLSLSEDTEMRHLPSYVRRRLAELLDVDDSWKELVTIIRKPDGEEGFLFNSANIRLLEQQKYVPGGSPTQALIDYWSTVGRKRPTIRDLRDLLIKSKLFRTAEYVSVNILNQNYVQGLADDINLHKPTAPELSELQSAITITSSPVVQNDPKYNITHSPYIHIYNATSGFSEDNVSEGGSKIGEGAFGSVYLAQINNKSYAVKKLDSKYHKQFENELEILTKFQHKNLLSLLGISKDGPELCLLYEFMRSGNLLEKISNEKLVNKTGPISWPTRIKISFEVSEGIAYLHSGGLIHRDIKSANILLDENLVPKVGDFGLARLKEQDVTSCLTTNIIGTSVYMAPEAHRGEISVKLDTYSFGVVMLELITGLAPYDKDRVAGPMDILSYTEEHILNEVDEKEMTPPQLEPFLDKKAGNWDLAVALKFFQLARLACKHRKKKRPTVIEINSLLDQLYKNRLKLSDK